MLGHYQVEKKPFSNFFNGQKKINIPAYKRIFKPPCQITQQRIIAVNKHHSFHFQIIS